jgi:hypothetical protein
MQTAHPLSRQQIVGRAGDYYVDEEGKNTGF